MTPITMEEPPTITITSREVYGQQKFYPMCDKAQIFAKIAGTVTLRIQDIHYIKALGYTVNIEFPEVKV